MKAKAYFEITMSGVIKETIVDQGVNKSKDLVDRIKNTEMFLGDTDNPVKITLSSEDDIEGITPVEYLQFIKETIIQTVGKVAETKAMMEQERRKNDFLYGEKNTKEVN